jgi:hypothetical protein
MIGKQKPYTEWKTSNRDKIIRKMWKTVAQEPKIIENPLNK